MNRVSLRNFNVTIFKFSEKFYHPFVQVFIFDNMYIESHGFVAMPVTSCIKDTCFNLSLSNLGMETKFFDINRHSNETVTLMKHVTKYKNMHKWMIEFLRKFENRNIILLELTRFPSENQSFYFNFVRYLGVRCDDIFKLTVSAHSIIREVCAYIYIMLMRY